MLQLEYWTAFCDVLNEMKNPLAGKRNPISWSDMDYGIGRSGFALRAGMNKFRVELSIDAENATYFFDRLQKQQNDIEQELGYPLKWEDKKPQTKRRRIAVYEDADPKDKKDWPRQHQWLAEKLNEFHRVFANRVKNLNPDDWRAEEENET